MVFTVSDLRKMAQHNFLRLPIHIFVFSIFNCTILPTTGFELRISGVGSDRSTSWATTTTLYMATSISSPSKIFHLNYKLCGLVSAVQCLRYVLWGSLFRYKHILKVKFVIHWFFWLPYFKQLQETRWFIETLKLHHRGDATRLLSLKWQNTSHERKSLRVVLLNASQAVATLPGFS